MLRSWWTRRKDQASKKPGTRRTGWTDRKHRVNLTLEGLEDRSLMTISPTTAWFEQGAGPIVSLPPPNTPLLTQGLDSQQNPAVGAIETVIAHPTNPDIVIIGAVNGGIWRTTNATSQNPTWVPVGDELPSLTISALAYSPITAQVVFAGTGSAANWISSGRDGGRPAGLYKSTDGGATWAPTGGAIFAGQTIRGIAPAVNDPNVVLVVTQEQGVYRSQDAGASFTLLSGDGTSGLPAMGGMDIIADPSAPGSYLAGLGPRTVGQGIYRSADGGLTWNSSNSGITAAVLDGRILRMEFAVHFNPAAFPAATKAIYVMATRIPDNPPSPMAPFPFDPYRGVPAGVFKTTNSGSSWVSLTTLPVTNGTATDFFRTSQGGLHFSITADRTNPNLVYIGGDTQQGPFPNATGATGFFGRHFMINSTNPSNIQVTALEVNTANLTAPHADSRDMVQDANGNIIETSDGGIYKLARPSQATRIWTAMSGNLSVNEFTSVAYDPLNNIIMGGAQDNGTSEQPTPNSHTWTSFQGGDGNFVQVGFFPASNQSVRYSSSQGFANLQRRTFNNLGVQVGTGVNLALRVTGAATRTIPSYTPVVDTLGFYQDYVINTIDANRMMIGTSFLWESSNQGDDFVSVNGLADLTKNTVDDDGDGTTDEADEIFPTGAVGPVTSIVYGGRLNGTDNPDATWVGTSNPAGFVRVRSVPGGPFAVAAGYTGSAVRDLVMDPEDWRRAYVLDNAGRVWRTIDAGATFTNITSNLAALGVTDLRSIQLYTPPAARRNMGTAAGRDKSVGVLVGGLGGVVGTSDPEVATPTWAVFGANMPNVLVNDLDFDVGDQLLLAGTYGRGAWTVSNMGDFIDPEDRPQFNPATAALTYVENAPPLSLAATATLTDGDLDPLLVGGSVEITSGFTAGEDVLAFSGGTPLTWSYNAATGVLTVSGTATVGQYQAFFRGVTYRNTSDNPNVAPRVVSLFANDGTGRGLATRTINLVAVNDSPVVTPTATILLYTENDPPTIVDPALVLGDPDSTQFVDATVAIGNYVANQDRLAFTASNGITGVFSIATGVLTLSGTATIAQYQTVLRTVTYVNLSDNPDTTDRPITFTLNDGNAVNPLGFNSRIVRIIPVNDPPVITTTGTLVYTENDPPLPLDANILVSDVDSPTLVSVEVRFTSNYQAGQDVLDFTPNFGITGSFNPVSGILTMTGTTSVANWVTVLRAVTYVNSSENPSNVPRILTFRVNDGGTANNLGIGNLNLTVIPVNDAPTLVTTTGTLPYIEGQPPTAVDPNIVVVDPDNPNLTGATITISSNYVPGEDFLAFPNTPLITGVFSQNTGILTLTGTTTIANYQAALRSVTYVNVSDTPSELPRTITFRVVDPQVGAGSASRDVSVTAVNDTPLVTTSFGSAVFTEQDAPIPIPTLVDPNLTVIDVDTTILKGASVTISSGFVALDDELTFSVTGAITGMYDPVTGILTFTGDGTAAEYQGVLRSVGYSNRSQNPSLARVLKFAVSDGNTIGTATRNVQIVPVNDNPTVKTSVGTINYIENQAATTVDAAVQLSDVDSTTLASAIVAITGNHVRDEDVLSFTPLGNIIGSFDSARGILALVGLDSLANYQAALRSVTYFNNSDNPSGQTRTITFTVNDGSPDNPTGSNIRQVAVTPVNDAPVFVDAGLVVVAEDAGPQNILGWASDIRPNNGLVATVSSIDVPLAIPDVTTVTSRLNVALPAGIITDVDVVNLSIDHTHDGDLIIDLISPANTQINLVNRRGGSSDNYINTTLNDEATTAVGDGTAPFSGAFKPEQSLAAFDGQVANGVWQLVVRDATANDTGVLRSWSLRFTLNGGPELGQNLTFLVTITGGDAGLFAIAPSIDPSTGMLSFTPAANASGTANLNVVLRDDGGTANGGTDTSFVHSFSIVVTPVNDPPVVTVAPAPLNYTENDPATFLDANLTVSDQDSATLVGATVTVSANYNPSQDVLTATALGNISVAFDSGAGRLTLSGVDTVANYEAVLRTVQYQNTSDSPTTGARLVTITVNDGGTGISTGSATRSVNITSVNDAPLVTTNPVALTITENQVAVSVDGGLLLQDLDDINLVGATVAIANNYAFGEDVLNFFSTSLISGTFNPGTGILTMTGVASLLDYQAALRSVTYFNTSEQPSAAPRTVTFTVNDGKGTNNLGLANRIINVVPVNDRPVVTTDLTSLPYTENQPATIIDSTLSLGDVDSPTLVGATVTISGGFVPGEDLLGGFVNTLKITGSLSPDGGTLTLTGTATLLEYQAALRTVTYRNLSENPSTAGRTIIFQVNDGGPTNNLGSGQRTVLITALNDPPSLTINPAPITYTENDAPTPIDAGLILLDVDSPTLTGATVTIQAPNYFFNQDELGVTSSNEITGTFDSTTGRLILTGVTSAANYQAVLRTVTYRNTSNQPDPRDRSIAITVNDGVSSTTQLRTFKVLPVNDLPLIITSNADPLRYTENQAPTVIDPTLTISDLDNTTLFQATVSLSPFIAGQDVLGFQSTGAITAAFNSTSGVLTLTALSASGTTVANFQAALRSVTYFNSSDAPDTTGRRVTFSASDDQTKPPPSGPSPSFRDIELSAVNDSPTLTPTAGILQYQENGVPTLIDPGLTVRDDDSPLFASGTVAITGNYTPGEDFLSFASQDGDAIRGLFNEGTGVLNLIGFASPAQYQAAMRQVKYENRSDTPSPAIRTVTFTAVDASAANSTGTAQRQINVVPVNDRPTVTAGRTAFTYVENDPPTAVDPGVSVADLDSATLSSASFTILEYRRNEDILSYVNTARIVGEFNVDNGTLTLTGVTTVADYQQALRSVTYQNLSDNPTTATHRRIVIIVSDGLAANTNPPLVEITITPVNDAPTVILSQSALVAAENVPTPVDDRISITDPDSPQLISATIRVSANYVKGEDVLQFTSTPTIDSKFDASTGTLTLTGTALVADYEAAIRSVIYINTSDTPTTAIRQLEFTINDGQAVRTVVRDLSISPVNDLVVLTLSSTPLNYTEGTVVAVDPALDLSDADNASLIGARVQFTAGSFVAGEDELIYPTGGPIGITGSFNSTTGVLTISGRSSLDNYRAALRSVQYRNTRDNPNPTPRTLLFVVQDTPTTQTTATRVLNIGPVNDAPTVITSTGTPPTFVESPTPLPVTIDGNVILNDPDSTTFSGAVVRIRNYVAGQDVLSLFTPPFGIQAQFDVPTGELRLTGNATRDSYQLALRLVVYRNDSTNPDTTTRVIEFVVTDILGASSAAATRTVNVRAINPIADILDAPTESVEGQEIAVRGQALNASTPPPYQFSWVVTRNGQVFGAPGTTSDFRFTPDDNGDYVVTLTVRERDGSSGTATRTIAVRNQAPQLSNILTFEENQPESVDRVRRGGKLVLQGTVSDIGLADTFTLNVDWSDGSPSETFTVQNRQFNLVHKYDVVGTLPIRLVIRDDDNGFSTATHDILVGGSSERFVTQIYEDILGRAPDQMGFATWTGFINAGNPASVILQAFLTSTEYRKETIDAYFEQYLHRTPNVIDPEKGTTEANQFLALMDQGGTFEQIQARILGSIEYFQISGGTNAGWITELYRDIFDRVPNSSERVTLSQALTRGDSRESLAAGLLGSVEYQQRLISDFYANYLHRTPDDAGLNFFVNLMQQQGLRDEEVAFRLLQTPEYFDFNRPYIQQVYQDLLGRDVDPDGLTFWATFLDQGRTRDEMVLFIQTSHEYREKIVKDMYRTFLRREADVDGLAHHVALLEFGFRVEFVQASILGSVEYFDRQGGGTDEGYLNALYRDVLHRAIDAQGRQTFLTSLAGGSTRKDVADTIFGSLEYERDFVEAQYPRFLRREGDFNGLSYFLALYRSGFRQDDIIALIAGSQEYYSKT